MQYTIQELAEKVNQKIEEHLEFNPEKIKDGRISNTISERRIRDYMTKGLLEKPIGKDKKFNDDHVEKLFSLRFLQHSGMSEQYILNNSTNPIDEKTDKEIKDDAFNYLSSLKSTGLNISQISGSSMNRGFSSQSAVLSKSNLDQIKTYSTPIFTQFNEYQIDSDTCLKLNSKMDSTLQNQLVTTLKNEIKKFKGDKND